jgi:hypothetical protein
MKSDSRVSIRRPCHGTPAPLSQRVVMPVLGRPGTQAGGRHDGVLTPSHAEKPQATGRTCRVHEAFGLAVARCSVFKDRHAPARRVSSGRNAPPRKATSQYRPCGRAGPAAGARTTPEAPLPPTRPPPPAPACGAACPPGGPGRRAPPPRRRGARPAAPARRRVRRPGPGGADPRCG